MKTKKLKIGVDIDGVLIDTDPRVFLDFCGRELGWKISQEAYIKTHSLRDATGQDSILVIGRAFEQFLMSVEEVQRPVEGAHEALKKLGEIADIFIITARSGILREITEEFLQAQLRDVKYHEISMDNLDNKARRVIDFGVDYFIDDSYHEISLILQNKSIDTTIIPFPGFHGAPNWDALRDDRLHWLSVWKDVAPTIPLEQQIEVRRRAWEEISELILNSQSAKLPVDVAATK